MGTATLLKDDLAGFNGHAALYRLDPPMRDKDWDDKPRGRPIRHVVVSAANVMFSGPETYIFAANAKGKISNWRELDGSYRGDLNHTQALAGAGYTIVSK